MLTWITAGVHRNESGGVTYAVRPSCRSSPRRDPDAGYLCNPGFFYSRFHRSSGGLFPVSASYLTTVDSSIIAGLASKIAYVAFNG